MLRTAGNATMSGRSLVVRAFSGVAREVGDAFGERGRQVDRSQREEQRQALGSGVGVSAGASAVG